MFGNGCKMNVRSGLGKRNKEKYGNTIRFTPK